MNSTLTDNIKLWIANDHDRTAGVEIRLLKRTFVLPWSQFLYAEGGDDEIRLCFATHEVLVSGARLDALHGDLSAQRVSLLPEPARAERFGIESQPKITSISVRRLE